MSQSKIEITQVRIFPVRHAGRGNLEAFAKIVLNDAFAVNNIRIVKGKQGSFVSFPREYDAKEGKGWDLCHPVTANLRSYMSQKILSQYESVTAIK